MVVRVVIASSLQRHYGVLRRSRGPPLSGEQHHEGVWEMRVQYVRREVGGAGQCI